MSNCAYYLAIDRATNTIYVTDFSNARVRRFQDGGTIDTVAGNGTAGNGGVGGPAVSAQLPFPGGVVVLPGGALAVGGDGTRLILSSRREARSR